VQQLAARIARWCSAYYKPVDFVEGAKLTRSQKDEILCGNAAKLLGLKRPTR